MALSRMTTKFISFAEYVALDRKNLAPKAILQSLGLDPDKPVTTYRDFVRDGYVLEQDDA